MIKLSGPILLHLMIYSIKWSLLHLYYSWPTCCVTLSHLQNWIYYTFRCEEFELNDLDNKDLVFLGISPLVDTALCLHCIRWEGSDHWTPNLSSRLSPPANVMGPLTKQTQSINTITKLFYIHILNLPKYLQGVPKKRVTLVQGSFEGLKIKK